MPPEGAHPPVSDDVRHITDGDTAVASSAPIVRDITDGDTAESKENLS